MNLSIITASQELFRGEVTSVSFPGTLGPFQVLAGHGPLVSSLVKGNITYAKGNERRSILIQNGFVSIVADQIRVVCTVVEEEKKAFT